MGFPQASYPAAWARISKLHELSDYGPPANDSAAATAKPALRAVAAGEAHRGDWAASRTVTATHGVPDGRWLN
jgi:hypothetical protein